MASIVAKCVFENDDLLRSDYGLGHRERMNEIRKELHNKDYAMGQMEADFAGSDWASPKTSDFCHFLRECYEPEERVQMLKTLKRCNCCSRHTHYRDLPYKPADAVQESKVRECTCTCRHYLRLFKRANLT